MGVKQHQSFSPQPVDFTAILCVTFVPSVAKKEPGLGKSRAS